jgi:hypothetical protein
MMPNQNQRVFLNRRRKPRQQLIDLPRTYFEVEDTSEPEKKTILMGHKISSFYAPSTQVFSHLFYFDRIKFL